jgi:hypothetical protein
LRWSTKEVAWTEHPEGGYYNGSRNIFFMGAVGGQMHEDRSGVDTLLFDPLTDIYYTECECRPVDLILAWEDRLVKR